MLLKRKTTTQFAINSTLRFWSAFVLAFGVVLTWGFALFTYNGGFLSWNVPKDQTVNLILNTTGCKKCAISETQIKTVFIKSFEIWNSVPDTTFKFSNIEVSNPEAIKADSNLLKTEPTQGDDRNVIGFTKDIPGAFAGYAIFRNQGSEIVEADIWISANIAWQEKDLQATVSHELGHVLGLGHDHNDIDSIMSYGRDRDRLRLGVDDIIGMTTLYPKSGNGPKPDLACTTFFDSQNPPHFWDNAAWNTVFTLLFWFWIWRIRRKIQRFTLMIFNLRGPKPGLRGFILGTCAALLTVACTDEGSGSVAEDSLTTQEVKVMIPVSGRMSEISLFAQKAEPTAQNTSAVDAIPAKKSELTEFGPEFGPRNNLDFINPFYDHKSIKFYCPYGK